MDIEALLTENRQLKAQLAEQKALNKDLIAQIPKIQAALSRGNMMVYNMKSALFNADDHFKHAVTLFDAVQMPEPIHRNIYTIADLVKQGKSISEMAQIILGDKKKKSSMHRLIKFTKEKHPLLFNNKI